MTDNEPYWTLAETVVWICTRDFTRVSSIGDIRSDAALAEETYKLLSEKTRTAVDPPDLNEIRDGAPKASWNVSGSADDQIIERARNGSVRAIGRRKWEDPLERIPPAEFIGLRIRTIPDGLERGQSIDWLDVQFRRADVMQQWPSGLAMAPALEGQDGEPTAEPRTSTQPHHEPPAKQDEPAPHAAAEIDVTQGDTREAEQGAPDDADTRKSKSARPQRGNPNWVRGSFYLPLKNCLRSKAKVLKKNGKTLRDWFEGLSRSEFRDEVKPALEGIKLPTDRHLYDTGKKIIAEIEKR